MFLNCAFSKSQKIKHKQTPFLVYGKKYRSHSIADEVVFYELTK
jgi:hypothetical protein